MDPLYGASRIYAEATSTLANPVIVTTSMYSLLMPGEPSDFEEYEYASIYEAIHEKGGA
jgi:hypothetical protein